MLLFPRLWILASGNLGRLWALWSVRESCLHGLELVSMGSSHEILRKLEGLGWGLTLGVCVYVGTCVCVCVFVWWGMPDGGNSGCCVSSPKPKQTPIAPQCTKIRKVDCNIRSIENIPLLFSPSTPTPAHPPSLLSVLRSHTSPTLLLDLISSLFLYP